MSQQRGEMVAMLGNVPSDIACEPLVSVLCVEANRHAQTELQKLLTEAGQAPATTPVAPLDMLRKLPGKQLRMSPHTTVQSLRSFLREQDASASFGDAHFFALRSPSARYDDAEPFLPLSNSTTLHDVLALGDVLLYKAEATDVEQSLVLVCVRENQYGGVGDEVLCGVCAGLCGCLLAMCCCCCCHKHEKEEERYEPQQQPQGQPQQYDGGYAPAQPEYYNNGDKPEYTQPGCQPPYYPGQQQNQWEGQPQGFPDQQNQWRDQPQGFPDQQNQWGDQPQGFPDQQQNQWGDQPQGFPDQQQNQQGFNF